MATVLLIVIFVSYIGLGIPDSLLGAAWPAIYRDFDIPISYANAVTTLISCGTVISSFFSGKVVSKLGTANVAVLSTALTSIALLGFSFSQNILWLCLFALPLGFGAGSIDAALNNYVALHYKANHMNFLHCSYGVGVSLSPYLMSMALSDNNNWRSGYKTMFYFQLAITVIIILSLPIWKRLKKIHIEKQEEAPYTPVKFTKALKIPKTKSNFGVFIGSCGIESICLVWGSSFLVESKGISTDEASKYITLYFVGLALGRFVSGLLANKISCKKLIIYGQFITLAAIALTALPVNLYITVLGLFLIGFGNGPLFPNMTHLTPEIFGKDVSQSMIGYQMAAAYLSILLSPVTFGFLAQKFSTDLFPYFQILMFVIMVISTYFLFKREKQRV